MLEGNQKPWIVTGVAGFIGSHLLEYLLAGNQTVVGIDNFSTGHKTNLDLVCAAVGKEKWRNFTFHEGDITDLSFLKGALAPDAILIHQAALGSVPRSIDDPLRSNASNVDGFLNLVVAAKEIGIKRFVYASSSSVYGDDLTLPKVESKTGRPLSPYAVTKTVDELYAGVAGDLYGLEMIGLRYFNVFGPRQDPDGAYAAVIPKWLGLLTKGESCVIYGDGKTSRDFCYVENAVQANILSGLTDNVTALNQVYNVSCGEQTSLNELYDKISTALREKHGVDAPNNAEYAEFRAGDVRHSLAEVTKAKELLGFEPSVLVSEGLVRTVGWFVDNCS